MAHSTSKSRTLEEKLIPGAIVSFKTRRTNRKGRGRLIAIKTNEHGKALLYMVRINEWTAEEHTRRLRLSEITGFVQVAQSQ